jgi:hypothetical protein
LSDNLRPDDCEETHVTHFLRSDKKPDGHKLEDMLMQLRADKSSSW